MLNVAIKVIIFIIFIYKEVLHAETGLMCPKPLVHLLRAEIYPKIEEFVKNARIVISYIWFIFHFRFDYCKICDSLGMDIHFEDFDFKIEEVDNVYKSKRQTLATQTADQLKHLIGDLKYLEEMKHLEDVKEGEKMARIHK